MGEFYFAGVQEQEANHYKKMAQELAEKAEKYEKFAKLPKTFKSLQKKLSKTFKKKLSKAFKTFFIQNLLYHTS